MNKKTVITLKIRRATLKKMKISQGLESGRRKGVISRLDWFDKVIDAGLAACGYTEDMLTREESPPVQESPDNQ